VSGVGDSRSRVRLTLVSRCRILILVGATMPLHQLVGFRPLPERFQMYLSATDLVAIIIALGTSVTLVITSAVANARLTRSVQEYRAAYLDLKRIAGK
jgi:hypothetical protein